MYICIYIYMYTYMYMCTYMYMYIYICIEARLEPRGLRSRLSRSRFARFQIEGLKGVCVYIYIYIHIYIYIYIYICIHTCITYEYTYICMYTYIYIYIYTYIYIYMYTYKQIYIYIYISDRGSQIPHPDTRHYNDNAQNNDNDSAWAKSTLCFVLRFGFSGFIRCINGFIRFCLSICMCVVFCVTFLVLVGSCVVLSCAFNGRLS